MDNDATRARMKAEAQRRSRKALKPIAPIPHDERRPRYPAGKDGGVPWTGGSLPESAGTAPKSDRARQKAKAGLKPVYKRDAKGNVYRDRDYADRPTSYRRD